MFGVSPKRARKMRIRPRDNMMPLQNQFYCLLYVIVCLIVSLQMKMYLDAVRAMEKYFKGFTAIHIPRSQNDEADKLAKAAARKEPLPPDVFYKKITKPSTKQEKAKQVNVISSEDWRSPIMAYLRGHFEPTDEKEGKRMFQRARSYTLSGGELYKSGVVAPGSSA